ncbi:hypothetical protein LCGC14_1237540 [marine sediment metagenome]|uniref:Uncharacterized protein n=1 Tax=marine sediment metagenome TaxID=412755 RepID=A0A0F9LTV7_9ZZZZ
MNIIIKEIFKRSYDPVTEAVYNYTILAQVECGKQIEIFDYQGYNLRRYIGKKIKCLLFTWIKEDPPGFLLKGVYIGKYEKNEDWTQPEGESNLSNYYAIQTSDGIFLINKRSVEKYNLKNGKKVIFYTDRIDLFSWLPI